MRRLPGWKPPTVKVAEGEEPPAPDEPEREPLLPEYKIAGQFNFISKNEIDNVRQQQMLEIQSIRDFLAKPHIKRDEKDKAHIKIPVMKTFERAILMPASRAPVEPDH